MKTIDDICDEIKALVEAADDSTWSNLSVGADSSDDYTIRVGLDPLGKGSDKKAQGVWLIPVGPSYDIEASLGRQRVVSLDKKGTILIAIFIPVKENSSGESEGVDVTNWQEAKKLTKFREELEALIIKAEITNNPLMGVETEPPQEVELKNKWYMTFTELIYDMKTC